MTRRYAVALVALVVAATGCGGGDGDDSQDGATTVAPGATTAGTSPGAASTTQAPAPSGSADGAADTAVVTIGDQTWRFGLGGQAFTQCEYNQFGTGNLFAALVQVDEAGEPVTTDGGAAANVLLELYADNYEELGLDPPGIEVTDEANGAVWIADIQDESDFDIDPGTSMVSSLTIDGRTASGTATFYDRNVYFAWLGGTGDKPAGVAGTFEVTCAE